MVMASVVRCPQSWYPWGRRVLGAGACGEVSLELVATVRCHWRWRHILGPGAWGKESAELVAMVVTCP